MNIHNNITISLLWKILNHSRFMNNIAIIISCSSTVYYSTYRFNNQCLIKPKKKIYNPDQTAVPMEEFEINKYISRGKIKNMGRSKGLTSREIKMWFQNRRMTERRENYIKMDTHWANDVVPEYRTEWKAMEYSQPASDKELEKLLFVHAQMRSQTGSLKYLELPI